MITFLTLFLHLVVGPQTVELEVAEPVTSVEILLDGRSTGIVLETGPWVFDVDLGDRLVPHRLTAVGRDAEGHVVAREEQWVNLPRPRAEVLGVLNPRAPGEPATARILYQSVDARRPVALGVTFDGEPLEAPDPRRVELPEYDPATPHLLSVELTFEGGDTVRGDTLVGGSVESTGREMTSVPVVLHEGAEVPSTGEMSDWVVREDRPTPVVAFERGPAEVVLVFDQDPGNLSRLREVVQKVHGHSLYGDRGAVPLGGTRASDRLRVLVPRVRRTKARDSGELFPLSEDLSYVDSGLFGILANPPDLDVKLEGRAKDQRLSDALAAAALTAAGSRRPRAVVLLVGADPRDASRLAPESVIEYFRALRVPLLVWSPFPHETSSSWGPVRNASSPRHLFEVLHELRELLDRQAMLWVEGRHLPQDLALSAEARSVLRSAEDVSQPTGPRIAEGEPTPEPRPKPEAEPGPSPAVASFAEVVEVDVVEVDVRVTGKDGDRVYGLTRDDFVLEVDGEPVPITQFRAPERPVETPSPADEFSADPFHLVLYLDHPNLRSAIRHQVLQGVERFVEAGLPTGSRLLLVHQGTGLEVRSFDPSETESLRDALRDTGDRASGRALGEAEGRRLLRDLYDVLEAFDEATDAISFQVAESLKRAWLSQVGSHVLQMRRGLEDRWIALEGFLTALGGLPGRKVLLYAGDGLTLRPAEPLLQAGLEWLPLDASDQARIQRDVGDPGPARRLEELARVAAQNDVTLYTLGDVGRDPSFTGVETGSAAPAGRSAFAFQSMAEDNLREAGCFLADETGGLCGQAQRVESLLTRAVEDVESVYSLGFEPPRSSESSDSSDETYHRLRVRLGDRGDLTLRHRAGFVLRSRTDRIRDRLLATLLTGVEANVHHAEVRIGDDEPAEEGRMVPVTVRFPVDSMVLLPDPQTGRSRLQARLLLAMRRVDGPAGPVHEVPIGLDLEPEQLTEEPPPLYAQETRLTLPLGRHWVALALMDEMGRNTTFLRVLVVVGQAD